MDSINSPQVEEHINNNMLKSLDYTNSWHRPLKSIKTEIVVYHKLVQRLKMNAYYDRVKIAQRKRFKYLGFHLDANLSFRIMIDAQFIKLRKEYMILKYTFTDSFHHFTN